MKNVLKFLSILIAATMLMTLCACSEKMTEEEIEAACKKEAENFVGGYLSCASTNYLEEYKSDTWYDWAMENNMYNFKPRPHYGGKQTHGIPERIADHLLTHATFEIDPYSFVHSKNSTTAELSVSVTIIPPQTAFDTIEDYVTTRYSIQDGDTAAIDAAYYEAVSMVENISPVTQSVYITFKNENGEWLIDNWTGVAQQIKEIR